MFQYETGTSTCSGDRAFQLQIHTDQIFLAMKALIKNIQQKNPPKVNEVRRLNWWTEAWGLHEHQSEAICDRAMDFILFYTCIFCSYRLHAHRKTRAILFSRHLPV